jgi:hypothetical protein
MNAIIKSGTGVAARRFTSARQQAKGQPAQAPSAIDPRDAELAALRAQLAARDAEIAAFPEQLSAAAADAEAAGREQMAAQIAEDRTAALDMLRAAIGAAGAKLDAALADLPALAIMVAREVLEAMFDDADQRLWILAALIRRHVAEIGEEMVVAIEVSDADFPERGEIEQLAASAGVDAGLIAARGDIAAGGCRMQLRLGFHDIGIDRQWGAFRALLDGQSDRVPLGIAAE